jgi:pilus assembly protein Flp/PilA
VGTILMQRMMIRLRGFAREEKGLALTEYLILLGLMTSGVVLSTALFGASLAQAWSGSMQVLSQPTLSASTIPSGAQTGSGNEAATPPEEVVTASLPNPSARDDDDDEDDYDYDDDDEDDDDEDEARNNGNRGNSDCRGRWCRDRD